MTPSDRNPRALLLAKDHETLYALVTGLERRGFEVLAATDGESGLELLLEHLLSLDVLVCDLDLPGRGGASLLELVRGAGGERDLAVVVRGERLDAGARSRLRALGADAVVGAADGAERVAAMAEEAVEARAGAAHPARVEASPAPRWPPLEAATTAFAAWPMAALAA